ncbi:hypothetical protein PBI_DAMIEN_93 [Mycobacterium phage Damien]|uniref:hypothetical protein n=1 Tax=Mycobacterium phage Damien TaxID=1486469 RepID=UPI00045F7273|nr:hypothetical protein HL12_gp93 [Mycobacterium phage Damien]AHZ95454.1 hypothetical protein PBI_DAMIEN_93 [Mycobacterium phage Damien]AXH47216.1 hypothetical protein SEA_CBORCH11_94 [Mycobacterium phage Cborch11]
MNVDFLGVVSADIESVCVSGVWLKCDPGSLIVVGNADQPEKTPIVQFHSAGEVVWADPSAVSAVAVATPLRAWPG